MEFSNFTLCARSFLANAYCSCGNDLVEVSNGFVSKAWFCNKCHSVYILELIKVSKNKITKKFIKQCIEECNK